MAKIIPIGQPVNDSERYAIAYLRDHLPDTYLLLHNFELSNAGERFEVDIALLAPHAVYLVDVKGTRGTIEVLGGKWYPQGRQPFASPLLKLNGHARTLKGLITQSQPGRQDLDKVYVTSTVLLTAPDAQLVDPDARDVHNVTTLAKAVSFFQNVAIVPSGRFDKNISMLHSMVIAAIQGKAKARSQPLRFGSWQVNERLSATDAYTEYRASNLFAGQRAGTVLLRVYKADPYLPKEERDQQQFRISNAFQSLNRLPSHPNIVGVRDFLATEGEDAFVFVTEDISGQALRQHIERPNLALTLDQKLHVAEELLQALAHAHNHGVIHRNLTPATILLGADGHIRLVGFEFARASGDRSRTLANEIADDLEPLYCAPEITLDPAYASPASDVFSAGLILYELFTGEKPFDNATELFNLEAVFPSKPSEQRNNLPAGMDVWLQQLCQFEPAKRPTASVAAEQLAAISSSLLLPSSDAPPTPAATLTTPSAPLDYDNLAAGTHLTHKFVVERKLGKGTFGVVYKVIDSFGDVARALKIIQRDRHSTLERLKQEYRTLLEIPVHPNVVRVIDADILQQDSTPYIVFEYVDGNDVQSMVDQKNFTPEDVLALARDALAGLVHCHNHNIYHCDIKPSNLIWTKSGVRIIDFNVSVRAAQELAHGGGSRRYLPPDLDLAAPPQNSDLIDRDLYALGITLYQALTGNYPWESNTPPPGQRPRNPLLVPGLSDLSPEMIAVLNKAIAPKRGERFASATEFATAVSGIRQIRRTRPPTLAALSNGRSTIPSQQRLLPPNTNPYVEKLLTLYSQSTFTNAGTRGLDDVSRQTYVSTLLDDQLQPAILKGEFRLVIITGNAGDGKTAFLQQLEEEASKNATAITALANGRRFNYAGHTYQTNYDGSQDEGDAANDLVLQSFFAPFKGENSTNWSRNEVRLIAINEGRLVDFLSTHKDHYGALKQIVDRGLAAGVPEQQVAVVNLNLRSVVANNDGVDGSILARLLRKMTDPVHWQPCHQCDLKDRCYAFHNARTFQDEVVGPKIIERLQTLYTLTHLRGQLHITLRDLRSALAFTLVGTRNCEQIHDLYQSGQRETILQGFYFNSWMGGSSLNEDRLLKRLKEIDIGQVTDPQLDRVLSLRSPVEDRILFSFAARGSYDQDILRAVFEALPEATPNSVNQRMKHYQDYLAMIRRRYFFERRDGDWQQMLPYRAARRLLNLIRPIPEDDSRESALNDILHAINRGEGLSAPERLSDKLALRVRHVENGSIRSYRLFPKSRFTINVHNTSRRARFVEHTPGGLLLNYRGPTGAESDLLINLDVFEMLERLNEGYRPSVEEEQGVSRTLNIFKNILGSEIYQEILLTTTGHDFYRIERRKDGALLMSKQQEEA